MTKPIEDANNAAAIRTALDVPTTAALNTVGDAAQAAADAAAAKYTKPSTGIPASDLAEAAQTSLGKAESSIQDLAGMTAKFNAGTATEQSAFRYSVSGYRPKPGAAHADFAVRNLANLTARGGAMSQSTCWLPTGIDAVRVATISGIADVSQYIGVKYSVQTTTTGSLDNPAGGAAMVPVTWAGSANPVFAAGSLSRAGMVWSDVVPVKNRGDGVNYLIARQWYPSGIATPDVYYNTSVTSPVVLGQRQVTLAALGVGARYGYTATDQTANSAAAIIGTPNAYLVAFELFSREKIISVAAFGDSTRQGANANGNVAGVDRYAIAKSLAGVPVSSQNYAITGSTSAEYLSRLEYYASLGVRTDIVLWQVATPNDPYSQASLDAAIARAYRAAKIADSMGARIVFDGPFPYSNSAPTAGQATVYSGARQFCLDMRASGYDVALYDNLCATVGVATWAAGYSADGIHETETGMASGIVPTLTTALDAALSGL